VTGHEQLRADLLGFVRERDHDHQIDAETSLIRSALIDSLALFQLYLHVEQLTGQAIDPTTFDIAEEWDTVNDIVDFIVSATDGRSG
jgi:acyl carrier protein